MIIQCLFSIFFKFCKRRFCSLTNLYVSGGSVFDNRGNMVVEILINRKHEGDSWRRRMGHLERCLCKDLLGYAIKTIVS